MNKKNIEVSDLLKAIDILNNSTIKLFDSEFAFKSFTNNNDFIIASSGKNECKIKINDLNDYLQKLNNKNNDSKNNNNNNNNNQINTNESTKSNEQPNTNLSNTNLPNNTQNDINNIQNDISKLFTGEDIQKGGKSNEFDTLYSIFSTDDSKNNKKIHGGKKHIPQWTEEKLTGGSTKPKLKYKIFAKGGNHEKNSKINDFNSSSSDHCE